METLLNPTKTTPKITWDALNGVLSITGYSFPENAKKVYDPIEAFIKKLVPYTHALTLNLEIHHCCSSSVLALYRVITALGDHATDGTQITVNWKYEEGDEDLERIGQEFQKLSEIPINFILV